MADGGGSGADRPGADLRRCRRTDRRVLRRPQPGQACTGRDGLNEGGARLRGPVGGEKVLGYPENKVSSQVWRTIPPSPRYGEKAGRRRLPVPVIPEAIHQAPQHRRTMRAGEQAPLRAEPRPYARGQCRLLGRGPRLGCPDGRGGTSLSGAKGVPRGQADPDTLVPGVPPYAVHNNRRQITSSSLLPETCGRTSDCSAPDRWTLRNPGK